MAEQTKTEAEARETLAKLVDAERFCMLVTHGEGGILVSRPMSVQQRTDDWDLLFVTQRSTAVAQQSDGKPVNLSFIGKGSFVSISGTGRIENDEAKKAELWNVFNEAYTEGGPENPDNVILTVKAESAEYWDSPNSVVTLVGVLAAAVTKAPPPSGDNAQVDL